MNHHSHWIDSINSFCLEQYGTKPSTTWLTTYSEIPKRKLFSKKKLNKQDIAKLEKLLFDLRRGRIIPSKLDIRTCLRCQKPFTSYGPHNRICNYCNLINSCWDSIPESQRNILIEG